MATAWLSSDLVKSLVQASGNILVELLNYYFAMDGVFVLMVTIATQWLTKGNYKKEKKHFPVFNLIFCSEMTA